MIKATMRFGSPNKGGKDSGGTGSTNITNVSATANTLAPGSSATASATLSANSLSFVFGIPEGDEGQQGPAGSAATIAVGSVTTGAAGTNASVTNSGTSSAAVFDFVIPRGADGSGSGDMLKSTYDTDNDGIVDEAETVTNTSGSGSIEFGLDADGKGQYRAKGASVWIPFLSGGPTETELWRNANPSSTFAEQNVVTFNPTDYDALKIVWKGLNTQSATPDNWQTDATAQAITYDLRHYASRTSAVNQVFLPATSYTGSTYTYVRRLWFIANQWTPGVYSIHIGPTQRTNNANANAAYNIPLLIIGVKF